MESRAFSGLTQILLRRVTGLNFILLWFLKDAKANGQLFQWI